MELEKMLPYDLELLIEKAQELLHQKESSNLTHHELQGEIQTDFTYKGINLKGTRPRQDAKNQ